MFYQPVSDYKLNLMFLINILISFLLLYIAIQQLDQTITRVRKSHLASEIFDTSRYWLFTTAFVNKNFSHCFWGNILFYIFLSVKQARKTCLVFCLPEFRHSNVWWVFPDCKTNMHMQNYLTVVSDNSVTHSSINHWLADSLNCLRPFSSDEM